MTSSTSDVITLKGGVAIHAVVILRALEFEERGIRLSCDDVGRLVASPRAKLTPDDDRFIRRHRDELIVCVQYDADQAERPL